MSKPVLASYCTTFLKPEMLHIYRQVSSLRKFETFVITKERRSEDRFPFEEVEIHGKVRSNFIRRFWLKYIKKEPPIVYRGEYRILEQALEKRSADMMHVYFGHTGVHLLPFIKRWDRPVVVSFHGMDVQPREDQPGYVDRLRDLLQTLPMVMARSESLKQRLIDLGCDEGKIRLNRTGIPMEGYPVIERPLPEGGKWRLIQACRMVEKKGLDDTLHVFAELLKSYPKAMLTLAGDGPLMERTEQLARELGITGQVEFPGFLDSEQLRDLYHQAHIFIHPSRITADQNQEGIPNAMLEAMATGLPVVATLHGGIPEAVKQGETGLLVEERDRDGLLEQVRKLIDDDAVRQEMGRAAAASMRAEFEHGAQIARLESYYRELLDTWEKGHGGE
ncbi:MAG: colanic acid biosynthesis glycosyltransferase WcaL [Verrucomicrobia bacterium]|nr:colanic acid biosynthesis glycosyltransferase WcaL [Verrucomicrobiota bacterium]